MYMSAQIIDRYLLYLGNCLLTVKPFLVPGRLVMAVCSMWCGRELTSIHEALASPPALYWKERARARVSGSGVGWV